VETGRKKDPVMARCGCSGASCSCIVKGSGGVTVTGSGSVANPYTVSSSMNLITTDSSTVDLTLTGDGSSGTPWNLTAAATVELDELTDVDAAAATTGQVLAKQASGQWIGVAPTTAPTGAINLAASGGLLGDGSAGNPLSVKLAPSSGLTLSASGLAMSGGGAWTVYNPATKILATTTNPSLGNGTWNAAYNQVGKSVQIRYWIVTGTTTTRGVGSWMLPLPVPPIGGGVQQTLTFHLGVLGIGDYSGDAPINSATGTIGRLFISTSSAAQSISHSVPASLPAGSMFNLTGVYEAA
jgi:hypothetical protein